MHLRNLLVLIIAAVFAGVLGFSLITTELPYKDKATELNKPVSESNESNAETVPKLPSTPPVLRLLIVSRNASCDYNDLNGSSEISVPPGSTFTAEVWACGVEDLANFDITVHYDPSMVQAVNVNPDPHYPLVKNLEHTKEGWIRVASINTGPGRSGTFKLLSITFNTVKEGLSSVWLKVNSFLDSNENNIPIGYIEDGWIRFGEIPKMYQ